MNVSSLVGISKSLIHNFAYVTFILNISFKSYIKQAVLERSGVYDNRKSLSYQLLSYVMDSHRLKGNVEFGGISTQDIKMNKMPLIMLPGVLEFSQINILPSF